MKHASAPRGLVAAAVLAISAPALAHNVCVPKAIGVPSRSDAPRWIAWNDSDPVAHPVFADLDDPRWLGAVGHSFHQGGAAEPLLSRALWSHGIDAGGAAKDYLYLSFIVDLVGLTNAGAATPRDLFVGFRRPSPFAGPGGAENAYIFQFHLTTGVEAGLPRPAHCAAFSSCDEAAGTPQNFWRAFVDRGAPPVSCGGGSGPKFERMVDGALGPPVTWMTPADANQDAVRFWKLDASQPLGRNRWAVQLRLPIAADDVSSLEAGIPKTATFWYEATAALNTASPQLYSKLGWWPRELTHSICPQTAIADFLVHADLGSAANWSGLQRFEGPRPTSGCDAGLAIDTPNIGSIFNATAGTDFAKATPLTSFKPGGVNTVIAQIQNLSTTDDVQQPLLARFRLAQWGSAPWLTPTEHGLWQDVRGAENGKCGAGAPPACAGSPQIKVPKMIDGDGDGQEDFIDADLDGIPDVVNRAAITFNWTLGNDPTLGNSEICKFGLHVPGAPGPDFGCTSCSCSGAGALCDLSSDTGIKTTVGTPAPCVSAKIKHQCLFVELSAPNGGVDFVEQSSWNNMNFDQMSVVSREALIDARQLPVAPGQKEQDLYLIAMPRNLPETIAGGATDGATFVRERALGRAESVAAPYLDDLDHQPQDKIARIVQRLGRPANIERLTANSRAIALSATAKGDDRFRERIQKVARALQIMPADDFRRTVGLLRVVLTAGTAAELDELAVAQVGPVEAASFVPTLEIYPFYRPGDQVTYLPMTAFTVFLSHEGSMTGMRWLIDGATRVGQNIYHLRVPVGFARRIQVRAEAVEAAATLGPNNPSWPCAGSTGCACGGGARNCGLVAMLGNTTPGVLAGVLVVRRRRKPGKVRKPGKQA